MAPMKRILLATCSSNLYVHKATSYIPPLASLPHLSTNRRDFFLTTSSTALQTSRAQSKVRPSHSLARGYTSMSAKDSLMSFETGYLNAKDAAALDVELMSTSGFSLEQLMELAGLAVAEAVYQVSSEDDKVKGKKRVLLVCGPGNNGGDGLVAARHLVHFGLEADVVYPKPSLKQHFINLVTQCEDMNIPVMQEMPHSNKTYDIVVDAIFGFSFDSTSKIREPFATAIHKMIQLQKEQNSKIISVDVPSGWDVDGKILTEKNFSPDVLISLTAPKMSAKQFKGRHFVGGRFLPPAIGEKYGVKMPPYPEVRQCIELSNSSNEKAKVLEHNMSDKEEDWAAQYQAYLDEKDACIGDQTDEKLADGEDWAEQYAAYCAEKEKAFFESYQVKEE